MLDACALADNGMIGSLRICGNQALLVESPSSLMRKRRFRLVGVLTKFVRPLA